MNDCSFLNIALKEWSVTSHALREGRQIILLRKGGIMEAVGGFQMEHDRFLLFPTYLHQSLPQLKAEAHKWFEPATVEPSQIVIDTACEVTDIVKLKSRSQMDAIDGQHIWASPLIEMRFNYKPQNPLYLLLVRAYRLKESVTIENTPQYAGCKSWVPLVEGVATNGAIPAMTDDAYDAMRETILTVLQK